MTLETDAMSDLPPAATATAPKATRPLFWSVRRELWENRSLYFAPATVSAVMLIAMVIGVGRILAAHPDLSRHDAPTPAMLALPYDFAAVAIMLTSFIVAIFYCLGALHNERRDRSILFWKSLPVSDTATVVSKVIAAVVIAPLIAAVVTLAGYIGAQIIMSVWFLAHGVNPFSLLWAHIEPFSLWLHLLAMVPVNAVWALPTVGWLLVWSAAVRSKPFLWAVVIPILAGVLNFWVGLLGLPNIDTRFFWGDLVGRALLSIVPAGWIAPNSVGMHGVDFVNGDQLAAISYSSMAHAFTLPDMWIGAVVGIALIAAAIWFRRWRDEA